MLSPAAFFSLLEEGGTSFFAGVPDSLLKDLCAYITDHTQSESHIIAANEGSALGLAAGHHLATGTVPVVYMQNSGLGNAVNPLLSLVDPDVYGIPVLLLVGWRGEPGVHDEPQHFKQGKVTLALLEAMGIPHQVLAADFEQARKQVREAYSAMEAKSAPYVLVIRRDTFEPYALASVALSQGTASREEAIKAVVAALPERAIVVATTGMISRELYEHRIQSGQALGRDFLTVGSMGHASQIALAIALRKPERTVCCFDGDGAVLMHMGGLATIGTQCPTNFVHVVFNNGAHDSVGGQPTVGFQVSLPRVAEACGYTRAWSMEALEEVPARLAEALRGGPSLLEIRVRRGARKDLGRPKSTPIANKHALMAELH